MAAGGIPPAWLESLLVDPRSARALTLDEEGNARDAGSLVARNVGGVLRFASDQDYATSFGDEWSWFRRTQLDNPHSSQESAATFATKTGWSPSELHGELVLDVGCGMGRFADIVSRAGARVVGVDLSEAVDAAQDNVGRRENVAIIQASVFELPFRPGSFDRIFSIGVLHHTPDPRGAFLALPRLLRPGGRLAVWVYSGEPRFRVQYALSDLYRLYTRRMDRRRLLRWCERVESLGRLYRTRLGRYFMPLLPVSTHAKRDWRVLDTFDWYSPRYQSKHTWREVESWFRDAGLVAVRRNPFEISVEGRAPTASSSPAT